MKKIIKSATAAVCLAGMALTLGSCQLSQILGGDTTATPGGTGSPAGTTSAPITAAVPEALDYSTIDLSKYVRVDYKNIALQVSELPMDPTDAELDRELYDRMIEMGLYELDATAAKTAAGDYIEMEYTGYMDGETFSGGTSEKATIYLDIENSGYIAGFADGLIGVRPGDEVKLELNFPDNYYEDLAGKAVTFNVKVHGICRMVLSDANAETLSSGSYKTMAEYREYLCEYLKTISSYNALNEVANEMWNKVIERSEILEYPRAQYEYYYALLTNDYISAAAAKGVDYDTYLASEGLDADKIDENIKGYIKTELLLHAIAEQEELVITEAEYDEYVNTYYNYYAQYLLYGTTKEQIVQYLREQAFNEKVLYTVFGYCTLTKKTA